MAEPSAGTKGFKDVPTELYRSIAIQALAPGKIFPCQWPDPDGRFPDTRRRNHPGFQPPAVSLLSLHHKMWVCAWDILLSHNTIVIGPGTYEDTAQWIDHLPDRMWPLIQSMEMALSFWDLCGYGTGYEAAWESVYNNLQNGGELATMSEKEVTATVHKRYGHEIGTIWHKKFLAIYCLKLKNLTLDFRHAECGDGCCTSEVQIYFAQTMRLLHGRPVHFQVLADNPKIARKIKKVATISLSD
ncbi:MAG: hypothetical protein M1836_004348 [Candelina mexicana]|nr:MAG: hypothetical protein M1836_004348 [Candelina mexicana]